MSKINQPYLHPIFMKILLPLALIIFGIQVGWIMSQRSREIYQDPSPKPTSFVCPETEWLDCMPGPDAPKDRCSTDYLTWAQANCKGFKGAAY